MSFESIVARNKMSVSRKGLHENASKNLWFTQKWATSSCLALRLVLSLKKRGFHKNIWHSHWTQILKKVKISRMTRICHNWYKFHQWHNSESSNLDSLFPKLDYLTQIIQEARNKDSDANMSDQICKYEWPRQNFSSQYQYNINQINNKKKRKMSI